MVRDVLELVEQEFQTSDIPLRFGYADLNLAVMYTNEHETGAAFVIFEAGSSIISDEATMLRMRVAPGGSNVSASANDLAEIIIANVKALVEAVDCNATVLVKLRDIEAPKEDDGFEGAFLSS